MASLPVPSMNAKVDAITDAVEAAIAQGNNHPGGVRRFILQGAICRALRDIAERRIAPHRFHGAGPNAGGRPTTPRPVPRSSRLQYAVASPKPSSLSTPSSSMLPLSPTHRMPAPTQPWNGGGGFMAGRRDATTLPKTDFSMAAWPSGFAYDLNVVLPQPVLPPIGTAPTRTAPSYADIAANRGEAQRRTASGAGGSSSIGGGGGGGR